MTLRFVVLASGGGSNLQAIIDACAAGDIEAKVVGVATDNPSAFAIQRATSHHIDTAVVTPLDNETRSSFDSRLATTISQWRPDLVVLAGFMRKLSVSFIQHFPNSIINLHPALPGQLPGIKAIERAFSEFAAGNRSSSGVMVHYVPDEGIDTGPVITSMPVVFEEHDTLTDFEQRMHATEHQLLISAIRTIISQRLKVTTP
jgi:phosphoribosylglycinamide formyltransferase 1